MYIGIDIGGTHIAGLLADEDGKELHFKKVITPQSVEDIEGVLCSIINDLASESSLELNDILAIEIGAAGSIDRAKGTVITSPNIKSWENYPIVNIIEKTTGIKVFLENDATVAVIGENWKGNGKRFKNWIMLTLGTGIGGGAVIDDKIYTGKSGNSIEFGHTTIDYNGKACHCGNRGCLEMYVSAGAIVDFVEHELNNFPDSIINRYSAETLTSKRVYEEAVKGDKLSMMAFKKAGTYLGIGISNFINIFNPEAVILGGGVSRAHEFLIPAISETVNRRSLTGFKENVSYMPVFDDDRAPLIGAVKLAIDNYSKLKENSKR